MDTELKITQGEWTFENDKEFPTLHNIWSDEKSFFTNGTLIARTCYAPLSEHNAKLIVDSGNNFQHCGLLPSELLKQNKEMRELLQMVSISLHEIWDNEENVDCINSLFDKINAPKIDKFLNENPIKDEY